MESNHEEISFENPNQEVEEDELTPEDYASAAKVAAVGIITGVFAIYGASVVVHKTVYKLVDVIRTKRSEKKPELTIVK